MKTKWPSTAATLMHAANTFLGCLVGQVHLELLQVPVGAAAHVPSPERLRYLARAVGDGRHPTLARLFAEGCQLDAIEAFDAGLEMVLDGIAARLGRPSEGDADHPRRGRWSRRDHLGRVGAGRL